MIREIEFFENHFIDFYEEQDKKIKKIKMEIKKAKNFSQLLDIKYGKIGTLKRDEYEMKANAFVVGELIKEERKNAELTQEDLASLTGTKKSYISRLENGKIDIQISTLFRIFEQGFGKNLSFNVGG